MVRLRARTPGKVAARVVRPSAPTQVAPFAHKEVVNLDGPSGIELGDITALGEREAIALRAAIDDAIHKIASRFNVRYEVIRGRADGTRCEYVIRLAVKPRAGARAR